MKKSYVASLDFFEKKTRHKTVTSIFFGGGTPSLASVDTISFIIDEIKKRWPVVKEAEISLEGNPDSLNDDNMTGFHQAGVNRLSVGVQSLNDGELRFLGRIHSAKKAQDVLTSARKIFSNLSADFIYTLPNQSVDKWCSDLEKIISLNLPHLSLYQLTLEDGTVFQRQHRFSLPDEETSALFFDATDKIMRNAGYKHYEISNFARKKTDECRHNLIYWQGGEYVGIGAGACSRFYDGTSFVSVQAERKTDTWLKNPLQADMEKITFEQRAMELIMMGLRLSKGIDKRVFKKIIGKEMGDFLNKKAVEDFIEDGFMSEDESHLRVTNAGRLILNQITLNLLS